MTLLLCLMLLMPPQDTTNLRHVVIPQQTEIMPFGREFGTVIIRPVTYESLLSDWDNYKAECWKDSTLTTQEVIPVKKNGKWEWSIGRAYYSHGHYPSFDGFMEYLKRKYKGE